MDQGAGPSHRYTGASVAAMFLTDDFPSDLSSQSSSEDECFDLSDPEAGLEPNFEENFHLLDEKESESDPEALPVSPSDPVSPGDPLDQPESPGDASDQESVPPTMSLSPTPSPSPTSSLSSAAPRYVK